MQELAWLISLALIIVCAAVFLAVILKAGTEAKEQDIQGGPYRYRRPSFWALVGIGVLTAIVSLSDLPYAAQGASSKASQVVEATGYQWYWTLSRDEVSVGEPVEFRVTSADVNHGFGIYDESLRLLAQTQAMPGYTNRLRFTFQKPGKYRILCLEYCGLGHHKMPAEISVLAR